MTDSNPPTNDLAARPCEVCGGSMTHLGGLPSTRGQESIEVHRCYHCDHVVSMPRGRTTARPR